MNYLGDFSRWTFHAQDRYTRVLQQQGRVYLDADLNEQGAIFWHYLRHLALDMGGPFWGPMHSAGFKIERHTGGSEPDLLIHPGIYYVDGVRCENRTIDNQPLHYIGQEGYDSERERLPELGRYLVYLEAWERHVSHIEDEFIREPALGGPDTAVRAKLEWRVRALADWNLSADETRHIAYEPFVTNLRGALPRLKATTNPESASRNDPCEPSPEARYRGHENQLYRVEIHRGGQVGQATFKWSRDNVVIYPIDAIEARALTLSDVGRDSRMSLEVGQWVEVVDDEIAVNGDVNELAQVESIEPISGSRWRVTLSNAPERSQGPHRRLHCWDHRARPPAAGGAATIAGTLLVEEREDRTAWIELEDGVNIQFQPPGAGQDAHVYRPGDYWWIPARTATRTIEWPSDDQGPVASVPHGVHRHYAPLAIIDTNNNTIDDVRLAFVPTLQAL